MATVYNGTPEDIGQRLLDIAYAEGQATTIVRHPQDKYVDEDVPVMLVDPADVNRTPMGFGSSAGAQVVQTHRAIILYAVLKPDANELPDDIRAQGRAMVDNLPALIRARCHLETTPDGDDGIVAFAHCIDSSPPTLFGFTGGVYAGLYYEFEVTTYV